MKEGRNASGSNEGRNTNERVQGRNSDAGRMTIGSNGERNNGSDERNQGLVSSFVLPTQNRYPCWVSKSVNCSLLVITLFVLLDIVQLGADLPIKI